MDSKDKKAMKIKSASSENKTVMAGKDLVQKGPVTYNRDKKEEEERNDNKMVKTKTEEPKGLPHQQVPQPGDFSTEALEHI